MQFTNKADANRYARRMYKAGYVVLMRREWSTHRFASFVYFVDCLTPAGVSLP